MTTASPVVVVVPLDPRDGPERTDAGRAGATALIAAALGDARRQANWMRLHGTPAFSTHAAFERGLAAGQIAIARYHLGADPDVATGAENEIRFLLGDYLRQTVDIDPF